ncbi:MAG: hypothetical protein P9L99_05115 [Candidatus Lernaella stagnicola]|nr:hypothetical protein [Candidatus Lernaella stagnicola]
MDKKTLIKMTVPKLREEALKIEGLAGVHAMSKDELLAVLFEHFNIPIEKKKKRDVSAIKKKVKELQAKKAEAHTAGDEKQAKVLQKRIHDLKRQTR